MFQTYICQHLSAIIAYLFRCLKMSVHSFPPLASLLAAMTLTGSRTEPTAAESAISSLLYTKSVVSVVASPDESR